MKTKQHCNNSLGIMVAIYCIAIIYTWSIPAVYALSVPGSSPPSLSYIGTSTPKPHLKLGYQLSHIPLQIVLEAVTAAEQSTITTTQQNYKPLKVGFGRALPPIYSGDLQPLLSWQHLSTGGQAATLTITSPSALAIRVGLYIAELPVTAELRFYSVNTQDTYGPFLIKTILNQPGQSSPREVATEPFWSPVIQGDTIGIEIYLPTTTDNKFPLRILGVQHLVYSPWESNITNLELGNRASSSNCEIDIQCATTVPSNLSAAVAKILFTRTDGTFLCTGTLLNDSDPTSFIPYFMTAHHCISTQSAANSLNSFWFFEKTTCNGSIPTNVPQFSGGSDLLATGTESDFTLLRLRDNQVINLPGIYFAGWSTLSPISKDVIGIHHPGGDVKKWSQGTADSNAYWPGTGTSDDPPSQTASHIQVTWSQGVTEGGSSGSGLFVTTGEQNNTQLFVGNLHGGWSFCSKPHAPDLYGRFDVTYPLVSKWLSSGDANGDSKINALDLITVANQILKVANATGSPDCDMNGSITPTDIDCIANKILGL